MTTTIPAIGAQPPASDKDDGAAEHITALSSQIAGAWDSRDRFAKAADELAFWEKRHEEAQAEGRDSVEAAWTSLRLGISRFYTQDYAAGLTHVADAERLAKARNLTDPRFWAELYSYASLLATDKPDPALGRNYADKAMAIAAKDGDAHPYIRPLVYNVEGYWQFKHGSREIALTQMCTGADYARAQLSLKDPLRHSNTISCGVFHFYLDRPETADMLEQSANEALANMPPGHRLAGLAFNVGGAVLSQLGRYGEAEKIYRKQLDIELENSGQDNSNVYDPASQIAQMLALQGKSDDAIAMQRQVIEIADGLKGAGDFRQRGFSRTYLATLLGLSGDLRDGAELMDEGIGHLRAAFPDGHPALSAAEAEQAYMLAHYRDAAPLLASSEAAVTKLQSQLPAGHQDVLTAMLRRGFVMARAGKAQEGLILAREAITAAQRKLEQDSATKPELVALSGTLTSDFSVFAEIAAMAGSKADVAYAAQMATASDLFLANQAVAARLQAEDRGLGEIAAQLQEKRRKSRALRDRLNALLAKDYDPADVDKIRSELAGVDLRAAQLQGQIETQFPDYAAITQIRATSLEEIQSKLGKDQAIIFPMVLYAKSMTIAITKDDVLWAEYGGGRPTLLAAREEVSRSIRDGRTAEADFDVAAALRLFNGIFPDHLYAELADKDEFLFPAGGLLAAIPPSLLVTKAQVKKEKTAWLLRDKAVSIFTDLSRLGDQAAPRDLRFAGLGDPRLAPALAAQGDITLAGLFRDGKVDAKAVAELPSLPGAAIELGRMREAFGANRSQMLTGTDFTEDRLKQMDFAPYSVVAFATHGLTSGELGGLSEPALVITPPAGTEQSSTGNDGLLTASEIAQMRIPVDWVILSACNSGAGRGSGAPTYSGLAYAFRLAGAKSLLLSHWQVRDDAAARLTVDTVTAAAKGVSKAQALRQAQLALMDDRSIPGGNNPAIWAPFILIEN